MVAYSTALLLIIVPAIYLSNQQGLIGGIMTLTSLAGATLIDRVHLNITLAFDTFTNYYNPVMFILLIGLATVAVFKRPIHSLIGLALSIIPFSFIAFVGWYIYSRYLSISLPGLFILSAIGTEVLVQSLVNRIKSNRKSLIRIAIPAFTALISLVLVCSFIFTAYSNPILLRLPSNDRELYINSWTGGYKIADIAFDLIAYAGQSQASITVIGMIGSCFSLHLYIPANVPVNIICPDIWDITGEGHLPQAGIAMIEQQIALLQRTNHTYFILVEQSGPIPISDKIMPKPYSLIKTYLRPAGTFTVYLYLIPANNQLSDSRYRYFLPK